MVVSPGISIPRRDVPGGSEQVQELLDGEAGGIEDRGQGPRIDAVMDGNDDLRERGVAPQHHVATLLSLLVEAGPLQGSADLTAGEPPREPGQCAETSTSTVS